MSAGSHCQAPLAHTVHGAARARLYPSSSPSSVVAIRTSPPSLCMFSATGKLHRRHSFSLPTPPPRSTVKQAPSLQCFLSILLASIGPDLAPNLLVSRAAPPDRWSTTSVTQCRRRPPLVSSRSPTAPKWNPRAALPLVARSADTLANGSADAARPPPRSSGPRA
jgi:hypothetical protein